MASTVNAHTEIPVSVTVIEKTIIKAQDKIKEAAKTENTEEEPATLVVFATSSAATVTKII